GAGGIGGDARGQVEVVVAHGYRPAQRALTSWHSLPSRAQRGILSDCCRRRSLAALGMTTTGVAHAWACPPIRACSRTCIRTGIAGPDTVLHVGAPGIVGRIRLMRTSRAASSFPARLPGRRPRRAV